MSEMTEAVRAIADAVLDLVERDPHQFSTRPCPSCRAISNLVGRRFGCVAMAAGEWSSYKP